MAWPPGFDLRALEVFLTVAETGSMAAAARHLGITSSAVSQTIAGSERLLGTALFDRSLRPMCLTPAGRSMSDNARQILALANQARRNIAIAAGEEPGELRLAVINSLTEILVGDLVAAIERHHNQRNVAVRSGLSGHHGEALLQRDVDVILTSDSLPGVEGLERHFVIREPFMLITPSTFDRPINTIEDIAAHLPFIRFGSHILAGAQIERHLKRMRISIPRHAEFDSHNLINTMVAQGRGWSISSPLCLAGRALGDRRLRVVPFPGSALYRDITLVARKGELGKLPRSMADLCRTLLDERCVAQIRKVHPWLSEKILSLDSPGNHLLGDIHEH